MKAAVREKYGSPDVVELRDVERPTPADDQVLVRVRAASGGLLATVLESLDDELDLAAARDALADPANAGRLPWEDRRARLGR